MAFFDETPLSRSVRENALGETDPYVRRKTDSVISSAYRRGVDQSIGLGADYLGSLAEAAGNQETADYFQNAADHRMRRSQANISGPQTLGDINGLGSAADYIANKAFESAPVSAAIAGTALATRGRSLATRYGAPAAVSFPVIAGETSYAMRHDEDSTANPQERALAATGAGAVGSVLEALPEVRAIGKALGVGNLAPAKSMSEAVMRGTKTFGESVVLEGITEGAQDFTSRFAQEKYNDNIGLNPVTSEDARKSLMESVAAGMAGGTVFGGPAAIGTTLQSMPVGKVPSVNTERLRQGVGNLLTPGSADVTQDAPTTENAPTLGDRLGEVRDNLSQKYGRARERMSPHIDKARERLVQARDGLAERTAPHIDNARERLVQARDGLAERTAPVRERLVQARDDLAERTAPIRERMSPHIDQARESIEPYVERARGVVQNANQRLQDLTDNVLATQADIFSFEQSETVDQEIARENRVGTFLADIKKKLRARRDLTEAERNTVEAETDLDPDAQAALFELNRKKGVVDTAAQGVERVEGVEGGKASRVRPIIPYEDVDYLIRQAKVPDDIAAIPEVKNWMAVYSEQLRAGVIDEQTINDSLEIFGEQGYTLLRAMASRVNAEPSVLQAIDRDQRENGNLDLFLGQSLRDEYRASITPSQLRQLSSMVRDAMVDGNPNNLNNILSKLFRSPESVMEGLENFTPHHGSATSTTTENEDGTEVEFGDTHSVQDVQSRIFGNTKGNRRIKTGGLGIPLPMPRDKFADIVEVAKNARGLAPESDIVEVPAHQTLRELGVSPADVAAEIGVTEAELRDMVFLQGTEAKPVENVKDFIRMLKGDTADKLNSNSYDPSAGSYLPVKTGNNKKAVIDVRKAVMSRTYGNREPAALLRAFADSLALAMDTNYKLDGAIPDNLVLARFGRGNDSVTITVGDARKAMPASYASEKADMTLHPKLYNTLQENGYDPQVDVSTGSLYLPEKEAVEIIERYAAAVAVANAEKRSVPIPDWADALVQKHGTSWPEAFGRFKNKTSVIAQVVQWGRDKNIDSRALYALTGRKADPADKAAARREAEAERYGMKNGEIESDPDSAPAAVIEYERGYEDPVDEIVIPRVGAATRTPDQPYSVRSTKYSDRVRAEVTAAIEGTQVAPESKPTSLATVVDNAKALFERGFWSTATLPSGSTLQGRYAILGKIASRGTPLDVVVIRSPNVPMDEQNAKLIDAYRRRGFNIRTETKMDIEVADKTYSEKTMARLLGTRGDKPAHMVMFLSGDANVGGVRSASDPLRAATGGREPKALMLARRVGIPTINLNNPVQQKVAGDILRAYDSHRRQEVNSSKASPEVKAVMRKGEERVGVDRNRDIFGAVMEKELASSVHDPDKTQTLLDLAAIASRVDDDFFSAGIAGRDIKYLTDNIETLKVAEAEYNKEKTIARVGNKALGTEKGYFDLSTLTDEQVEKLSDTMGYIDSVFSDMFGEFNIERSLGTDNDSYASVVATRGEPLSVSVTIENILQTEDPLSTVIHEAGHVALTLIQEKYGLGTTRRIVELANIKKVRNFIEEKYGIDDAQYYLSSPEELFVEAFAAWANGELVLNQQGELRKIFDAIRDFFTVLLGKEHKLLEVFVSMSEGSLAEFGIENSAQLSDNLITRLNNDFNFFSYGGGVPSKTNIANMVDGLLGGQPSVNIDDAGGRVDTATLQAYLEGFAEVAAQSEDAMKVITAIAGVARTESLSPEQRVNFAVNTMVEAIDAGVEINNKKVESDVTSVGSKVRNSRTRTGTERTATEEEFDSAIEYIDKVLAPEVRIVVRNMTTASGLYTHALDENNNVINQVITLSAYAADPMSVAFHESMHALIASTRGMEEQAPFIKTLLKAADAPLVIAQLRQLLKDHPEASQQMISDPEERIAYMYQFWAAGKLNLTPSVETWFTKMTNLIRSIFGVLANEQKAKLYMQAFKDGKFKDPSVVNLAVMAGRSAPERVAAASSTYKAVTRMVDKVIGTAHGRLKAYGNPALDKIADAFYSDGTIGGQRAGYLQTVRNVVHIYGSQFSDILYGMNQDQVAELSARLHSNVRPRKDKFLAEKYDEVHALLRRLYNYANTSGMQLAKVKDYFPQAWDKALVEDNRDAFINMLVSDAQFRSEDGSLVDYDGETAAAAWEAIVYGEDKLELKEDLAGFSPYMEAGRERSIILKNRKNSATFMDGDLLKVMTRYITQVSKRGEYTRHFGENGSRLREWLREAAEYGATEEEINKDVAVYIKAMEGTLGAHGNSFTRFVDGAVKTTTGKQVNSSEAMRSVMSGLVTWQNLAILPLAIFSSMIDNMGIVVRGGSMEQSWEAFKAGVKNIPNAYRSAENVTKSDNQILAEAIGTVESQNVLDMLGDMYGSAYMSDWARKTNNQLFRFNMMESWNTAMRSSATVAAMDFIQRHAKGENKNSSRWLDELGVSADKLYFDEDGKLLWSQADIAAAMKERGEESSNALEVSRLTREAITRWVDGAVLRPHAAHRPAWASDPHFMLIWHLKQFTYSFQKTILERVVHETRNGNYTPMLALSAYVPFMIAADFMRGLVQGAGEEPEWRQGMTFGETVWSGVQRAGILGVRQFAVDGAENPMFALGPTANYMYGAVEKTADGELGSAILAGLPGHAMWKGW